MFNRFFRQIFSSFGIFFRTIRAFFTRRLVGLGARFRRVTNFSRHATKVASASFQGAATALKKPTRREDYVETKWLFVSKSFLIKLLIGLIALGCLIYFVVWPFLLSKFFTAHFWEKNEKVENWSGKVVVYYDKEKDHPKYEGRLEKGVLQGQGKEYDEDGLLTYEGNFVDGMHSGEGTLYVSGVLLYQGGLAADLYEGNGVLYDDGVISYEGSFQQGVPHGVGKAYNENGSLWYDGSFQEALYEGKGTLYHPNGEVQYIGSFAEGMFDGAGKLMDENGQTIYDGGFAAGLYDGEGTLYSDGQPVYIGGFADGLREGEGEEYLPDGTLAYKGGYADDQWNGIGTEYRPDGTVRYKGGFVDGKYEGSGVLYLDDDRGRIEAVFAGGEPDGTIQWYIDEKLWYSGGADGLLPDGYGKVYTRSGKCIYAGEMDRGTIDGQWLLSLSAEEIREVFMEATVSEAPATDGGFFIINRELGMVARCMYRSEDSDTSVFSVWISRQSTEMAWQDAALYDRWTEDLKTEISMTELMPWDDAKAFDVWVRAMPEGEPAAQATFQEHEMTKERYYFDGWYCTAAIDQKTGSPNMVSWTVEGELRKQDVNTLLSDAVKEVQEEVETLLEGLAQTEESIMTLLAAAKPSEKGDASGAEDTQEPESGETDPSAGTATAGQAPETGEAASSETDVAATKEKQQVDADRQKDLLNSLLDYYEYERTLQALQSTQPLLEQQLAEAQTKLTMGTATQSDVDSLQLDVEAYQLRISQSQANMEKALLYVREVIEFDPAAFALQPLLICFDPSVLQEEILCTEADETDTVAVKASLINLKVGYETVQYNWKTLENAMEAARKVSDAYFRGDADQETLDRALCAQSDAVVQFYGSMIAFAREVNTMDHLTCGWLGLQLGWPGMEFVWIEASETEAVTQ